MILVTGGFGFIGTHVTRAILDLGESCVVTQRTITNVPDLLRSDLNERLFAESADIGDRAAFLDIGRRHKISGVVHLADPGVLKVWRQPLRDPELHLAGLFDGLINVLQAASMWGVERICLASTVGVYGGIAQVPLREDEPLPMVAGHAIPMMKKCTELLGEFLGSPLNLQVVSFRPSAIWGPGGRDDSMFFAAPRLIHSAVRGTAADFSVTPSPMYSDEGIDSCYVRDCGRAVALLQTASTLRHNTYNVGAGYATTNGEFAAAVRRLIPDAVQTIPEGRGAGELTYLDITRLRDDTGYEPEYTVTSGVADYVAWLRAGHPR